MTMTPRLRKLALTVHVTSSVGWLGAVMAFLALAIVGLASQNTQTVRAVYLAAVPITWYVLVPLAVASLLTGLTSSLGTPWGLFRHYWVLFKLNVPRDDERPALGGPRRSGPLPGVVPDPADQR